MDGSQRHHAECKSQSQRVTDRQSLCTDSQSDKITEQGADKQSPGSVGGALGGRWGLLGVTNNSESQLILQVVTQMQTWENRAQNHTCVKSGEITVLFQHPFPGFHITILLMCKMTLGSGTGALCILYNFLGVCISKTVNKKG